MQNTPGDFPANPLEKPGYTLTFNDDFDGSELDLTKWLPYYLPHWSSLTKSLPRYTFEESALVLQITAEQQPWCPEFNGAIKCSSIQTAHFCGPLGSPYGQHRFNPDCLVREIQPNVQKYLQQYGYFECRAKSINTTANPASLWMIGYEDLPEKSSEIAVFEILGAGDSPNQSKIGYGVHPWGDRTIQDDFYRDFFELDATCYHLYAVEWTPTHIDFYIDNQKIKTINQSANYPMQFMLGIYDIPPSVNSPVEIDSLNSYPKKFVVDYIRAYQPDGGY